ncbi:hypothetical protein [Novosphingobium sp. 9]|uniref:hypothetical protein n=1 Tax=Novosphingobium sp. 9 TaxID=2025349 RepID=UPI0021B5ACEB|nr:hypothetical protein [Novosphingobium sp. 9]
MREISVAIAGFGRVGRQIGELLLARRERYRAVYGTDVRLVAACGSRAGLASSEGLEVADFGRFEAGRHGSDFLLSAGPDVLIEAGPSDFVMGGPALEYLTAALTAGIDAVVVSKGALVHSGVQLRAISEGSGARLKISGATAAALPTIDLIETGLLGCRVLALEGVLNATTNYLLNAMISRGIEYAEALAEAQAGALPRPIPPAMSRGGIRPASC